MRKILAAMSLCAAATVASSAVKPTDLDALFGGEEYRPVLGASRRAAATSEASAVPGKAAAKTSKSDGYYMLQFESVADFDAAQRRRAQISASTGYAIQVVFDAPFSKLRGGGWGNKKPAEDEARGLAAESITAWVAKVK